MVNGLEGIERQKASLDKPVKEQKFSALESRFRGVTSFVMLSGS